MESPPSLVESLVEQVATYSKTSYELSKLRALETTAAATSSLVARLCVLFIFSLFVLVSSIGVALWLGARYGKLYYGFFIVAVLYFVMGVFLHFFLHQWIKKPVSDFVINQILQETDSCKK
jgi:fatty acid desaturase